MDKYQKPHSVQIKPGIVVELTTEEAIKLIQELFRVLYGETPIPSTPPQLIPDIVKKYEEEKVDPWENPYKRVARPDDWEPKWPSKPFEVWCHTPVENMFLCSSFKSQNGTH